MKEPTWLLHAAVLALHAECLQAFGGSDGVRDPGLLESALPRPQHLFHHEQADLCGLAAAYGHGIAKNHPFVDGNKRVAFTVARIFLGLNGVAWNPPEAEAVVTVEALASGDLTQVEFVAWLRKHAKKSRPRRR